MKKKTPLLQLIEWVDEYTKHFDMMPTDFDVKQKSKDLLKEERDMVEEAYTQGGLEYLHVHNKISRSFGKEVDIEVVKNDEYFTKNYTQK